MLSAVISSILSYPALQLALQPVHQWYVQPGPLVLGSTPLNSSTRIADRDRTVSRRSEPSSRTTLIGEQPNPWDLLQPQDVMSRHRGAKHCRRYELWAVSACYPRRTFYPLSDGPSTQNHRITMTDFVSARLVSLTVRQAYAIALYERFLTVLSLPSHASVTIWEATAQSNYPPYNVLMPDNGNQLDTKKNKEVFHWRLHKS